MISTTLSKDRPPIPTPLTALVVRQNYQKESFPLQSCAEFSNL